MSNSKFFIALEEKILPIASKIGSQRHMLAIRDAFSVIMSALIIGSLATLVNNFPVPAFQDFMNRTFGDVWLIPGNMIYNMTMGILGLLVTIAIGYYLGKSYKLDGISSAFITGITFLILSPVTADGGINLNWIGAKGLFLAMIAGITATELFRIIVSKGWTIKMPDGVPPAVTQGFVALTPSLIIFTAAGLIAALVNNFSGGLSVTELFYQTLQAPFQEFGDSIFAVCVLYILRGGLWFFGIHGTNVMGPITNSIMLPNMEENARLFSQGVSAFDVPKIATSSFGDAFVSMGGTGVGLAFAIALIMASKNKPTRDLAIGSTPAALFNINEPLMYGTPIVLNVALIIPFLLAPVACIIIAYTAMASGLVPKTVALIPWNMPIGIGGYLATGGSVRGALLQFVNLAVSVAIYLPFIRINDRIALKEQEQAIAEKETQDLAKTIDTVKQ